MNTLNHIMDSGIISVIRADSSEQALKLVDAVTRSGVDVVEITLTVPGAIKVIEELKNIYNDGELLLGAGTVLDSETACIAINSGADFIVGPNLSKSTCKLCNRYQVIYMPGCSTITEVVTALECGADVIKLFPGSIYGPQIVKSFKGPLPQAEFIPTGGVSLDNVEQWIKNGCIAVGVGSELTAGANQGDYDMVQRTGKEFIKRIKRVRNNE